MPVDVKSVSSSTATQIETQRKVFRNPRGLQYYYAFFVHGSIINCRKSLDGSSWVDAGLGTVNGLDPSIWIYEHVAGSRLIIYLTYKDETNNYIMYRWLRLGDSFSSLSYVGAEQTVDLADEGNFKPMIFVGRQGYIHIVYEKDIKSKGKNYYHVYIASTTSTHPTSDSPTWTKVKVFDATTEDYRSWAFGSPCFGSTYEGIVGYEHSDAAYEVRGKNFQWNGSSHTIGTERTINYVSKDGQKNLVVEDAGTHGIAHYVFIGGNGYIFIMKWTIGTGFGSPLNILSVNCDSIAIGIDRTSSTPQLIVFYKKNGVSGDFFYKTADVDWSVLGDWSSETKIDDDTFSCNYLSCSYEDWNGDSKIQLIYTRQLTVRYAEVDLFVGGELHEKGFSPSSSLSSSFGRLFLPNRVFSPSAPLSSSFNRYFDGTRNFSPSSGLSSSFDRRFDAMRGFSPSTSLSSVFDRVIIFVRGFSPTLTLASAFSRFVEFLRTFSPSTSLSSAFSRFFDGARSFSPTATLSSAFDWTKYIWRTFSPTTSLSSSFSRYFDGTRTFSPSTSLSSTFDRVATFMRGYSPTASLSSAFAQLKYIWRTFSPTLTLSSSFSRFVDFLRTFSPSTSLSSSFDRFFDGVRGFSPTLTLSSIFARFFDGIRTFVSNITLASVVGRTVSFFRTFVANSNLLSSFEVEIPLATIGIYATISLSKRPIVVTLAKRSIAMSIKKRIIKIISKLAEM